MQFDSTKRINLFALKNIDICKSIYLAMGVRFLAMTQPFLPNRAEIMGTQETDNLSTAAEES